MKTCIAVAAALMMMIGPTMSAAAQAPEALATVEAVTGNVQVAPADGQPWTPAAAKMLLSETQVLKTGLQSQATIRFTEGDLVIVVGENTQIALQDLLLKARLEKMRGKVNQPTDANQTKMQVTPLTGVRGTDASDSKAEDPKREHTWNENDQKK
jgi:hypothetical protein